MHLAVYSLILLALTGCNKLTSTVVVVSIPTADAIPERIEYSDWSLTLSRGVKGNEIDVEKLRIDPAPLDAFLKQASAIGPKRTPRLFPDDPTQLAFLINLQNAAMAAALIRDANADKAPAAVICTFDGRAWTTDELRREIGRLSNDDWRVLFALFDGRRDGPPLWPQPILPEALDAQLTRIAASALRQPQIVSVDHLGQKLRLWSKIYDIHPRLIEQYEQRYKTTHATVLSALLDLADPDRRGELNTAVGYPVARMPPNPAPAIVSDKS